VLRAFSAGRSAVTRNSSAGVQPLPRCRAKGPSVSPPPCWSQRSWPCRGCSSLASSEAESLWLLEGSARLPSCGPTECLPPGELWHGGCARAARPTPAGRRPIRRPLSPNPPHLRESPDRPRVARLGGHALRSLRPERYRDLRPPERRARLLDFSSSSCSFSGHSRSRWLSPRFGCFKQRCPGLDPSHPRSAFTS
jgi:hypothetical protein